MEIPNRSLFKAPEVCEIAQVQPYVLRSWEAEFPDLGVAKGGGQRVYRRADVQRVLRIKELLFVEGLTLAGARRRLEEEHGGRSEGEPAEASIAELLGADARERIADVRQGLRWILDLLAGNGGSARRAAALFEMGRAAAPAVRTKKHTVKKKKARR
ncbi:MAG: MerR family transcriptional regulator [Vicinamibacterales bacterium]